MALEEAVDENIETCVSYLKRMAPMKQWLEMEIGITVGHNPCSTKSMADINANSCDRAVRKTVSTTLA
jgi:fructose/tagatose bisphosphate aldolase